MQRSEIFILIGVALISVSYVVVVDANPYARSRSNGMVYEPILIVQPVYVPVGERRHPSYTERLVEVPAASASLMNKRTEVTYRTLDEYQKKGRPGQPLRFGKRALLSYHLARRPQPQFILY